jgi:hypothetical protein
MMARHLDWMYWTLGILAHFQAFSGFEFFLLPSRVHARPSANIDYL